MEVGQDDLEPVWNLGGPLEILYKNGPSVGVSNKAKLVGLYTRPVTVKKFRRVR